MCKKKSLLISSNCANNFYFIFSPSQQIDFSGILQYNFMNTNKKRRLYEQKDFYICFGFICTKLV